MTDTARKVGDHDIIEKGARLGMVMSGVIHLVIAWIALKVAWDIGGGSDSADKSGALATVAGGSTGPCAGRWFAGTGRGPGRGRGRFAGLRLRRLNRTAHVGFRLQRLRRSCSG